jgi:hypothetical protein
MDNMAFLGCMKRKFNINTLIRPVPGDVLVFSLVLITISASFCPSYGDLQGRVMEAYSE